jgi:hypothetical protein
MFDLLLRKKRWQQHLEERIIWGIWAPRKLQLVYKELARGLRVPISVLVYHILRQWLSEHYKLLSEDLDARTAFGDLLAREDSVMKNKSEESRF